VIRLTDGFDLCSYFGAALKYNQFNRTFNQGAMIAGRDGIGQALWIQNTAFGIVNYSAKFDSQNVWGFNMDWQWSGGSQPDMVWYQISIGGSDVLFSLRLRSDGTMDLLGPLGSTLANTGSTSTGFAPGQWCTLELKVTFGTAGQAELRKNGVRAAITPAVNFGATLPDTHSFGMEDFGPPGPVLDNLIIWDGQAGDPFTTFYGRQRILSSEPIADLQPGEWQPSTPGPSYPMVDDHNGIPGSSPDGDTTYLEALATGPDAVFEMQATPCSGLILALVWNACMRPDPNTAVPGVDMVFIPLLSTIVVGHASVAGVGYLNPDLPAATIDYLTYQGIVATNPQTGSNWGDQDIANATFGVGAAAAPQVRLTAFYLEKVIDLTGLPFECGGGSYAYT
jgi:hypothetical protein